MSDDVFHCRFVDSTIIVTFYGFIDDACINGQRAEHIRLDSQTEDSDYSMTHIFRTSNDSWEILDEIPVFFNTTPCGTIKKDKVKRHRLVAMTLFKEDYKLIPAYVKYYTELGVEHFFLYYNKTFGSDPLPNIDNVTYIQWNYPYYNGKGAHCAQITSINNFLYWAKHFADYVLFNDMDEFIQVPLDLGDKLCYGFINRFIVLDNPEQCEETCERIKNKNYKKLDWTNEYPRRSKCIVSTQIYAMGVHCPNIPRSTPENTTILGEFHHVTNFACRSPVENID